MNTKLITKALPLVLTIVGCVGVAVTGVLSARAAVEADHDIQEEQAKCEEPIGKKEAVKLTWTRYIPAVLSGALTIAAIVASHKLSAKEIAALSATCTYLAANRNKLEEKIRERYGDEELEDIHTEVTKELMSRTVSGNVSVENTGHGNLLCLDGYSGRYFRSSKEAVDDAIAILNDEYCQGEYLSFNDLYRLWGIGETHFGNQFGWPGSEDYHCGVIRFKTTLVENCEEYGEDIYIIEPEWGCYPMECWMEV